jgi:hypothetical protein
MTVKTRLWAVLLSIGLAACSTSPVRLGPDSDPRVARQLLANAAATGPVPLAVNELPVAGGTALTMPQVARQAARGVTGMTVSFDGRPEAAGSARLLLLFDPLPGMAARQVCTAARLPAPAHNGPPLRLQAVFCDAGAFIADASAAAEAASVADVERLIWRTTGRLFPDDWQDTYGLRQLGWPFGDAGSVAP